MCANALCPRTDGYLRILGQAPRIADCVRIRTPLLFVWLYVFVQAVRTLVGQLRIRRMYFANRRVILHFAGPLVRIRTSMYEYSQGSPRVLALLRELVGTLARVRTSFYDFVKGSVRSRT